MKADIRKVVSPRGAAATGRAGVLTAVGGSWPGRSWAAGAAHHSSSATDEISQRLEAAAEIRELLTAALAATARMDLCLHHPHLAAESLTRRRRFVHRKTRHAAQGLHAEHGAVTEDDILMELTRWVESTDNDILSDIYQQTINYVVSGRNAPL